MQRIFVALAIISSVILTGCAQPRVRAHIFDTQPAAAYRLASGDRLRVIVFGQDSLSNTYSVDTAGNISMPLIGSVRAQGMSPAGLARRIEARLRNGFVREPRVSVEVDAYRPFFVLGEVTTAGQFPYVNDLTVEKAIAIAGGFAPRAYRGNVNMTRVIDGQPVTAAVPLTQLVQPGDTILVRERFF
ncbi:MAG: polysaccharide export protein [Hyphomicrobiales bacterium]|nr:polysaccharide export protein [Hyphomicrobiales bacterium]